VTPHRQQLSDVVRLPLRSATSAQATIIESIVTGSRPPEEILERLNQFDIEWYITEQGDLMIKSWQVGAESFVPRGRVAELRTQAPAPSGAESLEWVSKHLGELQVSHGDKWVAVAGNEVVAAADDVPSLMEALEGLDIEAPFITQIPAGAVIWRTLYGR